jgi:hypothetical protein
LAELEIHHESEHAPDPAGRKVGVLAALLAVGLTIVTIASHRTHTQSIVLKTEANDQWQYYQSKRIKFHNLELGVDLIGAVGASTEAAEKVLQRYEQEKERYQKQADEIQQEAQKKDAEAQQAERRALRYDFGEGLLEIGLVLTSLFFISRKRFFPVIGIIAGLVGLAIAVTGLFI